MAGKVEIDFRNLRLASKTLKEFDPDLRREMFAAVGSALKPIVADARSFVQAEPPMSGWAKPRKEGSTARWPMYDAVAMRSGFKQNRVMNKRMPNGWRAQAGIKNTNPAAVIYEVAGTKNPWGRSKPPSKSVNPRAGGHMISMIQVQSEMPRTHYKLGVRAVVKNYRQTRFLIETAIRDAENKFYAKQRMARRQFWFGREAA